MTFVIVIIESKIRTKLLFLKQIEKITLYNKPDWQSVGDV